MSSDLDPELYVNFAIVARTKLKHIAQLKSFYDTYPDTKTVFHKVSLNKLWVKEDNVKPLIDALEA